MKKLVLSGLLLICCLLMKGYHGVVVDEEGTPIPGASVNGLRADSTYISSVATDTLGIFNIDGEEIKYLNISSYGKDSAMISIDRIDLGKITLNNSSKELEEVVVMAKDKIKEFDKTTYFLSKSQLDRHGNPLQALNEIPFITVLQNGGLYYKGFNNVIILLDGQPTNTDNIKNLSKSDIKDIVVYDIPPAKYITTDFVPVINVVTKSGLRGGTFTMNLNDDIRNIFRDYNSLYGVYNYKDSRFSAGYNMELSNSDKYRYINKMEYEVDGQKYGKIRNGKNDSYHSSSQSAFFKYMNRKADNYQFNADFNYSFSRNKTRTPQDVKYLYDNLETKSLTDKYIKSNSYNLNLYFDKQQKNGNNLSLNVSGNYAPSAFYSGYSEYLPDGNPYMNSFTAYKGRYYSLQGSMQYTIRLKKIGHLSFFGQDIYTSNELRENSGKDRIWFNQSVIRGSLAGWISSKLAYRISAGLTYDRSNQKNNPADDDYSSFSFTPFVSIFWDITDKFSLSGHYSRYVSKPSLSQLNENTQWIDSHYIFHGNKNLKPYTNNNLSIDMSWETSFGNISANIWYMYAKDYFTTYFTRVPEGILETYANIDRFQQLGLSVSPTIYLLRNKRLYLSALMNLSKVWGKGHEYSWQGVNFQLMPAITYSPTNRWTFQIDYQYPGKTLIGHLIRPRAEHLGITAMYAPTPNMQISLYLENPFMNFKESEYTAKGSIVKTDFITFVDDWKNRVSINFYYTFDFGKRKIYEGRRKLNYQDSDNGVLSK